MELFVTELSSEISRLCGENLLTFQKDEGRHRSTNKLFLSATNRPTPQSYPLRQRICGKNMQKNLKLFGYERELNMKALRRNKFSEITRPQRTRLRNRESREAALLSAAGKLFAARGYEATTTREIAACAGCAEGLISRYFRGKAGLLRALIVAHTYKNNFYRAILHRSIRTLKIRLCNWRRHRLSELGKNAIF